MDKKKLKQVFTRGGEKFGNFQSYRIVPTGVVLFYVDEEIFIPKESFEYLIYEK